MSETCRILEFVQQAKVGKVDRENGVIYDVKFLGESSVNPEPDDNDYPKETRARAIALLEGRRICINHPANHSTGTRPYQEGMGIARAVHEKGDGLYGNWHFPPKHHLAEQVFWDAENAPNNLSFSINGDGKKRRENGRALVEEITMLESVDLVSRGATTKGLFEGARQTMRRTLREWINQLSASRPGFARGLREVAEAGIMPETAPMEEPAAAAPTEGGDHEAALKQGFRGAIIAVLDDDSLDMQGKLAKIKEIMKAEEKLIGGGNGNGATEAPAETPAETPATESQRRQQGNLQEQRMQLQLDARDWCSDAGVVVTPILRMALKACANEGEVRKLIESAKAQTSVVRSANPYQDFGNGTGLKESQKDKDNSPPTDPKEFAAWVQGV